MIAEDYKDVVGSATKLYQILRQRLLTCKASEKLPVIYVLDSVLKNCKGCYVPIVEQDAATWMTVVYQQLDTMGQAKLQKVWRTWNEFQLFASVTNWKAMGRCFTETNAAVALSSTSSSSTTPFPAVAGIARRVRAIGSLPFPRLAGVAQRRFLIGLCLFPLFYLFIENRRTVL